MKKLHAILMLAFVLIAFHAFAGKNAIESMTQGDVEFVMGGVGEDEHKAMRAIQSNYNMHLVFAVKDTGEYVTDVKLKVTNSGGKTVLDTVTNGPDLFAKLHPGQYKLVADRDGHVIKETILVPKKHGVSVTLYWPMEKGD